MPPTGFEPVSRAREARMINRTTLQGHGPDRIRTGVWWSEATQDIQATSQARIRMIKIHLKIYGFSLSGVLGKAIVSRMLSFPVNHCITLSTPNPKPE